MTVKNEAYARTCANMVAAYENIWTKKADSPILHMKTSTQLEQPEQKMQ